MKRVLMLASVASMIDQFNMSNISLLLEEGFEVHAAANFEKGNTCPEARLRELKTRLDAMHVPWFQVDFSRDIRDVRANIRAYGQVKRLMMENGYSFVHCHSPIGGVCGRLAARAAGTRALYTAHGFHFYKGAPLMNWLLYYPVERFLSRYTETLITINKEDFERAGSFNAKRTAYVPGVGVDVRAFAAARSRRSAKRAELGLPEESVALLSIGELNKGKNHRAVIEALARIDSANVLYLVSGIGNLDEPLRRLASKLGVLDRVRFLGFREDIPEILAATDIFVFPSLREGLPLALMEAMAAGLPVVCSNIRGNRDLIEHGKGGYLAEPNVEQFAFFIEKLLKERSAWRDMGGWNMRVIDGFDEERVKACMRAVYASFGDALCERSK